MAPEDHRRSPRFPVVVPVEVRWRTPDGSILNGEAQAREVNTHGAMLHMRTHPPVGSEIELTNLLSTEATRASVVAVRHSGEGAALGVAVELAVPSETFWGVSFRLRRTTAELLELERAIQPGDIDPRVLREFRDAVDYVRSTAWVVYEWHERQLEQRDAQALLSLLAAEHVHRTTQLSNALAADLEAGEVTHETPGTTELFRIVERVYKGLADLLRHGQAG